MDTRRLHYFLVLAEELHFGRAALRLAISQPPLSVSIRQLEESIGAKLFERSHQQVRLTAAGKALIPAAQALLDRMESMLLEVQNVAHGVTGHLRIGYVGALLYQGLPELMQQFQQRHAGMQLSMRELNTCNQLSELAHGSLDVGFIHTSPLPAGLSSLRFSYDRLALCLPVQHPLAAAGELALNQLKEEPFILFARRFSPRYYDRIQSVLLAADIEPDTRWEARHWLGVVALVARGCGIALVPASLRFTAMAGVSYCPLPQSSLLLPSLCVWNSAEQRPLLSALIAMLRLPHQRLNPADDMLADRQG